MDQRALAPDLFRSKLLPGMACFYTIAAICGIPGIVFLLNPESLILWQQEMTLSGITSGLAAWRLISVAVSFFSCICPAVMAAGLWLALCRKARPGMGLLTSLPQMLFHGTTVTGVMALAYLIYRVVRFVAYCTTKNEGLYLLYTTLIPESVMVLQAWFLWKKLRQFLECFIDTAASITYTLSSSKLDSLPTPGFTATGFWILAIFGIVLAADQIFTMTIVYSYPHAYYKLLTASHWSQYLAFVTLLSGAIANILASLFLRRYNRLHERALYYAKKRT